MRFYHDSTNFIGCIRVKYNNNRKYGNHSYLVSIRPVFYKDTYYLQSIEFTVSKFLSDSIHDKTKISSTYYYRDEEAITPSTLTKEYILFILGNMLQKEDNIFERYIKQDIDTYDTITDYAGIEFVSELGKNGTIPVYYGQAEIIHGISEICFESEEEARIMKKVIKKYEEQHGKLD